MVNIVVCVKEVLDVSQIKVDKSSGKPILTGVPKKISDFDKNAVETAIQLKEKHGGNITVITVGPKDSVERLREALAMGADKAVIISDERIESPDALCISNVLAGAVRKMGEFDIIICGEVSMDDYSGQVGPRLASLLNIPQLTYAKSVSLEDKELVVERDLGDTTAQEKASIPALVTVTKEINTPRLPKLMDIMRAKSKPVEYFTLDDIGVEATTGVCTEEIKGLSSERKQVIIEGASEENIGKIKEVLGGA